MPSAPAIHSAPNIRPSDRLGFTLFIATLIHLALLLGIGFTTELPRPAKRELEVTLAKIADTQAPKQADYIAQAHQQGSGNLEQANLPKEPEPNRLQAIPTPAADSVTPEPISSSDTLNRPVLSSLQSQPDKASSATAQHSIQSTAQPFLELEQAVAELINLQTEYAKRPRINRQNAASTKSDISASYRDAWRKKIERIGNLHYPKQKLAGNRYGSLRLLVIVRSNGSIQEMLVTESSGNPLLDQTAQAIVRLAAPFPPFTGELADRYDQIEIIRTWRFEPGKRLLSP